MSQDYFPKDPRESTDGGAERRRERRLRFTRKCTMTVTNPPWAITPKPLVGITDNITSMGIKISGLQTAPGQAKAWSDSARADREISVIIVLPELPNFPELKGQIAWVHETGGDGDSPLTTSVGILFSILRENERHAVQKLVAALEKELGPS